MYIFSRKRTAHVAAVLAKPSRGGFRVCRYSLSTIAQAIRYQNGGKHTRRSEGELERYLKNEID